MNQLINLLVFLLWILPVSASTIDVPLSDPVLEARAKSLFYEIRCMVCTSETIADSHAEVAGDMRRDIREKIKIGISKEVIKANLATQYGDVILMKPPLKNSTLLLWFGPWLVLFAGTILIYFYFRSGKQRS